MKKHRHRGFTLVELVVVIIVLGILAAFAVPRFIDMSREARVASLNTLAAAARTVAMDVRAACKLQANCDYDSPSQNVTIAGRVTGLTYGWIDSGDILGADQIDGWLNYSGFTASLVSASITRFALDGAPNPATCSVDYSDAVNASHQIIITITTSGC